MNEIMYTGLYLWLFMNVFKDAEPSYSEEPL
jgi:hypothetical protein